MIKQSKKVHLRVKLWQQRWIKLKLSKINKHSQIKAIKTFKGYMNKVRNREDNCLQFTDLTQMQTRKLKTGMLRLQKYRKLQF